MDSLTALAEAVKDMEAVELRLAPDETAYIINLTADEADKVLEAVPDSAASLFETSVSCIGASICQVGSGIPRSCWQPASRQCGRPALRTAPFPRSIYPGVPPPAEPTRPVPSVSGEQAG